jgi:hypothetical protein
VLDAHVDAHGSAPPLLLSVVCGSAREARREFFVKYQICVPAVRDVLSEFCDEVLSGQIGQMSHSSFRGQMWSNPPAE